LVYLSIIFYFIRIVRLPAVVGLGFWIFYQILMSALSTGAGGGVTMTAGGGGATTGWSGRILPGADGGGFSGRGAAGIGIGPGADCS
jgi:hypothetical protein